MGANGEDVCLSSAAWKSFPFTTECKNQEINKTFLKMWDQAKANTECADTLLVLSANNSPVIACMTLDYLMDILTGRAFKNMDT